MGKTKRGGRTINFDVFERLCNDRGWTTDAERCRQLEISHAHLTNLRANRSGVGGEVVDALLRALEVPYKDLICERGSGGAARE